MNEYIWYCAYGSNLLEERFYLYITGGKIEYIDVEYNGCTDKTPPKKTNILSIPYDLYFSQRATIWENKAVAFIKSTEDHTKKTLCKLYLIYLQVA